MRRISCIILLMSFAPFAEADLHVWTETQTVRIVRDTPSKVSGKVRLSAARNEWVGFQILARSDKPLVIREIRPIEMRNEHGESIAANNFFVFRQHQIHLKEGTPRNDLFTAGWYPDPLIPVRHPLTGATLSGRLRALPFSLPPDETHGFWIDIYVPKDIQTGLHEGTITIIAEDNRQTDIPIELRIWDFVLPDTPTMQTAFGNPVDRMQRYYKQHRAHKDREPTDWPAVEKQVSRLMSEHRINAAPSYSSLWPTIIRPGEYRIPENQVQSLRSFIDQYHVNAVEVPNPTEVFQDPLKDRNSLHVWLKAIGAAAEELNRPDVILYTYLADEPNDWQAYQFVRKWGRAIREANSVVKVLITEQTKPQNDLWGDLYGAVDIWCSLFPLFDPVTALKRQREGEIIWAYTALCQEQKTPWWHIDYPLLNYRVPAWIAWRYAIQGLLYWGGMCHWTEVDDPWTDARTYRHPKTFFGKAYNGEGTLVYPARPVGYDGIVPSLRLKALRSGIQDYEYLAILKRLGLGEEGEKKAVSLAISWFNWNEDPEAYERARQDLARLIVAVGKSR